jgi:hypothetical protein
MSMKNSNDTIGNWSHDLPVGSAVHQPLGHHPYRPCSAENKLQHNQKFTDKWSPVFVTTLSPYSIHAHLWYFPLVLELISQKKVARADTRKTLKSRCDLQIHVVVYTVTRMMVEKCVCARVRACVFFALTSCPCTYTHKQLCGWQRQLRNESILVYRLNGQRREIKMKKW